MLTVATSAIAQPYLPPANAAALAKDLEFPTKPSRLGMFTNVEMAIYKPDGSGPFPGLVLFHHGAQRGVDFPRGVLDAFQAADHLRAFDFVDKDRIGLAGYSWGAMVAVLASSKRAAAAYGTGKRFAAAVSFYPGCFTIRPTTGSPYEIAHPDIDRPLLVLMGGNDNETPPADCTSKLEPVKAGGAPVELHVYPDAAHCWDCRQLDGFSKTDVRGNHVTYKYDKATTEDSARRMFEFLEKALTR